MTITISQKNTHDYYFYMYNYAMYNSANYTKDEY